MLKTSIVIVCAACLLATVPGLGLVGTVAFAQTDKRADFVQNVVPRKYPELIDYLRNNGPLQVSWITQSGEPQSITARLSAEGYLVIETAPFFGSAATASTTKDRTFSWS